jgi:NADPH2:quinone reductase
MRAVGIHAFGGRDRLEVLDVPRPEPAPGEVVIAVHAAGVNPIDWKIREGLRRDRLPHVFPVVLGWDAAGVVESLGEGVDGFGIGEKVFAYARTDVVHHGAYAEAIALPAAIVAPAPRTIDAVHAAAVPLASLTAWQALDALEIAEGETVLVHAAAGGVGAFAVQLARVRGARVLGTATAPRHEWLRELGCDAPIDYARGDLQAAVRDLCPGGADAVLDAAGGDALAVSPGLLRDGGRLVSIVEQPAGPEYSERGIRSRWIFAQPDGAQLREIADLVDAGRVRVHIEATYALEDVARAHAHLERRHVRGKLVLRIAGGAG